MREVHPYGEFVPKNATSMIIGSFPIGKFTDPKRRSEIKPNEFDFFFGGEKNLLWKILAEIFNHPIEKRDDIKELLKRKGIAIGDVVLSCRRKKGRGSDSSLYDIKWNQELLNVIKKHKIHRLYFTSKGVELWFNRLFPYAQDLEKVSLISPSGQSVRSLSRRQEYVKWSKKHPHSKMHEFIYDDYRQKFSGQRARSKKMS